ncbi:hypothetical protein DL764_005313 [Monosporascus ibericus]|uniref:Major facilitator superfamily (MFS) profile domain-containing protein n=1 Tax=Monosporascus ibericus TaxID=155417 RepID=A0A4V1XAL9_9PEZI|nr:hypothetical protein DL764_005313 [Monosporascus ibericus]
MRLSSSPSYVLRNYSHVISITHVIGDSFGITNPGELSWLIAGYSLTVGTFIVFSGRLGDVFGYKTMYLLGMAWHLVLEELDMPGTVTGVAGRVLINLAWNQAPIADWSQPYVYVTLLLGFLILAVFFVIEIRYATHPLIPFNTLTSDVSFTLGAIACGWGCFGIWVYYSWQFLLVLRAESPLLATAHFSPVAISGAVAAILTGALMHPMLIALFGMDMSFPAGTLILSDAMPRRHQGIAASLVSTVVNYSISIALGFAGTVDVNVNNGGLTEHDVIKGYRGALYMAIGLAGLGVAICLAFLVKTKTQQKKLVMDQDKAEA